MPPSSVTKRESSAGTIAFLGDYLPRKCGIATFTSDLLGAVAARHPHSRCFAVPVNDVDRAIGIRTRIGMNRRNAPSTVADDNARAGKHTQKMTL